MPCLHSYLALGAASEGLTVSVCLTDSYPIIMHYLCHTLLFRAAALTTLSLTFKALIWANNQRGALILLYSWAQPCLTGSPHA